MNKWKEKDKRRKDEWDTCNGKSSSSREKPHTLLSFSYSVCD